MNINGYGPPPTIRQNSNTGRGSGLNSAQSFSNTPAMGRGGPGPARRDGGAPGGGNNVYTDYADHVKVGQSSGGGASSVNIFSHYGQGDYQSPYVKDGPAVVAPKDFRGLPGLGGASRPPLAPSGSSGSYGYNGGGSSSRVSSGGGDRRSIGQAGSNIISQRPGSGSNDASPLGHTRGQSHGGGSGMGVASAMQWGGGGSESGVGTMGGRRHGGAGNSTSDDVSGIMQGSFAANSGQSPHTGGRRHGPSTNASGNVADVMGWEGNSSGAKGARGQSCGGGASSINLSWGGGGGGNDGGYKQQGASGGGGYGSSNYSGGSGNVPGLESYYGGGGGGGGSGYGCAPSQGQYGASQYNSSSYSIPGLEGHSSSYAPQNSGQGSPYYPGADGGGGLQAGGHSSVKVHAPPGGTSQIPGLSINYGGGQAGGPSQWGGTGAGGRSSTRVTHAPGGNSQWSFG